MTAVVGVDVGGTAIKAGVVERTGTVTRTTSMSTPRPGTDAVPVIDAVADVVATLSAGEDLAGVGVVVPGIVDEEAGIARMSENLGWVDIPFRAAISDRLQVPVAFGHDVRAGGLAEHRIGACQGARRAAFVPIGTGVAAGRVLDGAVYAGGGYAGEIGHVDVGTGLSCSCGGRGCLETVGSAAAVARRYTDLTGVAVDGARDVALRKRRGDPVATTVWDEGIDALSAGLAVLVAVVAPEVIAIGGGLAAADDVVASLVDGLDRRLTFHARPRVVRAALGNMAGCVGAGLLAWSVVDHDVSS